MDKKINELLQDRKFFNEFVYTPLDIAISEFEVRYNDKKIEDTFSTKHKTAIPDILKNDKCMVLSRPIATPNYEFRRFLSIADTLELKPLVWEYTHSKFVPQNETKYALARMGFFEGKGKKGGMKINYLNVLDIQNSSGKYMDEIKTFSNESLVDFHHRLFTDEAFSIEEDIHYFDASEWYKNSGANAKECYPYFLSLFIKNGILFENFMLDEKEYEFTRDVFLPAFIKIPEIFGFKPLIVALEATEIEGDRFWSCYPSSLELVVKERTKKV